MQRGIALGAVFLSCLYVAGYVYKYSFFSLITYEVGWADLDPSDYIAWGVYSLIDIFRINVVALVVLYAAALTYFSDVMALLFKVRGRIYLGGLGRDTARALMLSIGACFYYLTGLLVFLVVAAGVQEIEEKAKEDLGKFLESNRADFMCEVSGESCVKGKLFYTSDNEYIFYEHGEDVYSGKLHVAHKRNVYVQVGWNESSESRMRELSKGDEGE